MKYLYTTLTCKYIFVMVSLKSGSNADIDLLIDSQMSSAHFSNPPLIQLHNLIWANSHI